jgi:hypothetical protein
MFACLLSSHPNIVISKKLSDLIYSVFLCPHDEESGQPQGLTLQTDRKALFRIIAINFSQKSPPSELPEREVTSPSFI